MKIETSICIWTEYSGDFAHIKGYICNPVLNANGQPEPVDRYEHPFYNVRLHSQASLGYHWTGMYGMSLNVECYDRITLQDAKKAIDTLSPIEKRLAKMQSEEGEIKSYGQWLNRVARAIGAKTVFFKRDRTGSSVQYLGVSGGDIVYHGDSMEQKIGEWANPKSIAA